MINFIKNTNKMGTDYQMQKKQKPTIKKDQNYQNNSQISSDSITVVNKESQVKPFAFQKHTYSYIMLMVSCIAWVTGFIYSNQNKMNPFETTISRYTLMFFVTYFHCRWDKSPLVYFNRPHERTLISRNIVVTVHSFVVTFMQFYLPLAIFHTLVISGQIFIFLANYLFKGVKITTKQMIGVGISFIGLALIINGRYLYELLYLKKDFQTDFDNYVATDTFTQIKMGILYVLWNAVWAVSVVYTKIPQYSPSQILFTQSFTGILISAVGYIFVDSESKSSFEVYWPSVLYCSLLMVANYLFTYGVIWSSNTGISTMMLMSSAVFGYFISIFRYNQEVNGISIIGTIILVTSAGFVVWQQQKVKN